MRELTNDVQVDESLSLSMFVLDDDLVAALVRLLGVLQLILCAVGGGMNVVFGQAQVAVEPVGLSLWVGTVGDGHNDGLPGICDIALVCGLYLRHSWRRREQGDTVRETTPGHMFPIRLFSFSLFFLSTCFQQKKK